MDQFSMGPVFFVQNTTTAFISVAENISFVKYSMEIWLYKLLFTEISLMFNVMIELPLVSKFSTTGGAIRHQIIVLKTFVLFGTLFW